MFFSSVAESWTVSALKVIRGGALSSIFCPKMAYLVLIEERGCACVFDLLGANMIVVGRA